MGIAGRATRLLPAAFILAASLALPPGWATVGVLAAVILLGVPHGALDGEFARPMLRPRFGRWWFAVFALPYLGLAGAVLVAWRVAPLATLAAFLAASVVHFGVEDSGPSRLEAVVRGGIVIAVPVLAQPAATARFLGTAASVALPALPGWLVGAALLWCVPAALWAFRCVRNGGVRSLVEPGILVACFCALPPLTAFALYFVCVHGPRHMAGVVADRAAPRVGSVREAAWRAGPTTALTVLIGAALWPLFPGAPPERLLALTIQGLAALTLPHMLLDLAVHEPGTFARWRLRGSRLRQVAD